MKKFGAFALLVALSVFAVGCEKPKEKAAEPAAPAAEGAAPAEGAAAAPAEAPAQ